jgi:type II secretion system protein H
MTSPTGKPKRRGAELPPRRGFTLIELLLVMTLLLVVISVTLPSLGGFFRGRTLDSEARRLLALTRHGQSRAASEGVPMLLYIDQRERFYGLEEEPGYFEEDTKAVEYELDRELEIDVINLNSKVVTAGVLGANAGTRGNANPLSSTAIRRNLPAIRFLPDGSIDEISPQILRLIDRTGIELWVMLSRNQMNYEIRLPTNQWDFARP